MDKDEVSEDVDALRTKVRELGQSAQSGAPLAQLTRGHSEVTAQLRELTENVRRSARPVQVFAEPRLQELRTQLRAVESRIEAVRRSELLGAGAAGAGQAGVAGSSATGSPGAAGRGGAFVATRPGASLSAASGAYVGMMGTGAVGGGAGAGGVGGQQQQQQQQPQVKQSTALLRSMVQSTEETRQVNNSSLAMLQEQGEAIDRAHDNVRRIQDNMVVAHREIGVMKSFFGAIANGLRGKKKAVRSANDVDFEVEWLRRKKWEEKIMRIGMVEIVRVGSTGVARESFKLSEVNGVLVKPDQVEISFGKEDRHIVRTPQWQQLVATLYKRKNTLPVAFDDPALEFDYVNYFALARSGAMGAGGGAVPSSQPAQAQASVSLGSEEDDQLLEAVSRNVDDIGRQGQAMRTELTTHISKLQALEEDVDQSDASIKRANKDIQKLLGK